MTRRKENPDESQLFAAMPWIAGVLVIAADPRVGGWSASSR